VDTLAYAHHNKQIREDKMFKAITYDKVTKLILICLKVKV